jgi:hypothetical protein
MVENRIAARHRVMKVAKIEFGATAIDCTVRDLSLAGAAIEVPSQAGIPERFTLVCRTMDCICPAMLSGAKNIGSAWLSIRPPQLAASFISNVACWQILLQKYFSGEARKF